MKYVAALDVQACEMREDGLVSGGREWPSELHLGLQASHALRLPWG